MAIFTELRPALVGWLLLLLGTVYVIGLCVYRIFFHPLAKYPGPLIAKITDWYSAYHNYIGDVHIDVLRCHEIYGDFVRYGPEKLVVNSVTGFHDIYAHGRNVIKSHAYAALQSGPGIQSVLTAWDKKEHGRKRRVISQGFTETAVRGYEPIIQSQIKIFCEKLVEGDCIKGVSEGQGWSSPKNMAFWSSYFSSDIMADVIFSNHLDLMNRPDNRFLVHTIETMMHRVGVLSQVPQMIKWGLDFVVLPYGKKAAGAFKQMATKIAVTRVQLAASNDHRDAFKNLLDAKDPETGKGFEMMELLAETGVLIVAGSDTTSSALSALFFYLSRNPEAYRKLTEEVRNTFSNPEDIRSGPELRSCTYLRACIDEAMRMSPPVSSPLWREVQTGGVQIDSEHIPQSYSVATGLYALHHNPAYFRQPFKYSPERWIPSRDNPQEDVELAKKAFAPFLIGARMCAAKNMAVMELLLTVAHIAWAMDFKVADGPAGVVGQGGLGMARGRQRDEEFQLYAHFVTVGKKGPFIQFRKREQGYAG